MHLFIQKNYINHNEAEAIGQKRNQLPEHVTRGGTRRWVRNWRQRDIGHVACHGACVGISCSTAADWPNCVLTLPVRTFVNKYDFSVAPYGVRVRRLARISEGRLSGELRSFTLHQRKPVPVWSRREAWDGSVKF